MFLTLITADLLSLYTMKSFISTFYFVRENLLRISGSLLLRFHTIFSKEKNNLYMFRLDVAQKWPF
jgi:hypothetical protein